MLQARLAHPSIFLTLIMKKLTIVCITLLTAPYLLLAFGACRAQTKDSLIALTEYTLETDSIQATDGAMLPFAAEFIHQSRKHHVPAPLLAGITQVESRFEPFATRTEPSFQKNPIVKRSAKQWSKAHRGLPTVETELQDRSRSYGLMQPMGELAREQGYDSTYLATLYIPDLNIEQGAIKLDSLFKRYKRDTMAVISGYNLGSAKRSHGAFENAQYVYSVLVATHFYEKALHYAYLHNQSEKNLRLAGRHRDTADGCSRTQGSKLQPQSDSSSIAQNNGHAGGLSTIAAGYDLGSRHDPPKDLPKSQSEYVFEGLPPDLYLGLAAILAVIVLGLTLDLRRYLRKRARHHLDLPRRSDRHFLPRSEIQPSRTDLSRAFHTHG
jgi:hypothetical protein